MISYLKFEIVIVFGHHLIVSTVDRMRLSFMPMLDVVLISSVVQFEFVEGASWDFSLEMHPWSLLQKTLSCYRYLRAKQDYCGAEWREEASGVCEWVSDMDGKRKMIRSQGSSWNAFVSSYFSAKSFLMLLSVMASLIFLPLVLPPMPPPPLSLLLVPIGIFLVLLILAFMPPSGVQSITSSCL